MEEKPKSRTSRQKDEAPAFTSSVFALLDVYLTKMLVRPQVNLCNILDKHFDCGLPHRGPGFVLYNSSLVLDSTGTLS